MSRSCRRAREREETAVTLEGVQILQEGTLEGVQILQEGTGVRKIAQLQLQRMQVLRCQECEQSFFACRVGPSGRAREREQTAVRPLSRSKVSMSSPDLAGGHGREKRPLQGVQILQEGTGERRDCSANGVPICKT